MEQPEEAADAPDAPRPPDAPEPSSDAPEPSDVPEAVPAPAAAVPDAPRGRRRGRTAALIGAALVLGLVAGTCAGYLVQAGREPTPLPPLSQPVLAQAEGEGPEPLSAAQDRRVRTDGDLRKLLLKKPRGAKSADWLQGSDGWLDLADYAESYTVPYEAFGDLITDEFRRAAVTAWEADDGYTVEISLVQFRQEQYVTAADSSDDGQRWAGGTGVTDDWAIPGTGTGRAYVVAEPETEPGYPPVYSAEAHAWRGDIAMHVWVTGPEPVPKKTIMDLAERQMERL